MEHIRERNPESASPPFKKPLPLVPAPPQHSRCMKPAEPFEGYKPLLFSMGVEVQGPLDSGNGVSDDLRRNFESHGFRLSRNVKVSVRKKDSAWLITDEGSRRVYYVRKVHGRINVYHNIHVVNQIVERDL